jgi:hypothetical protein
MRLTPGPDLALHEMHHLPPLPAHLPSAHRVASRGQSGRRGGLHGCVVSGLKVLGLGDWGLGIRGR